VAIEVQDDCQTPGKRKADAYMPIQSPQAQILYELQKKGSALFLYLNTTRPSECNRVPESIDNLVRTLLREEGFPKAACGLTHFATTPLHIAAKHGEVQTTNLLLELGYPLFEWIYPGQLCPAASFPHTQRGGFSQAQDGEAGSRGLHGGGTADHECQESFTALLRSRATYS
jgi:hypothetical protein